jgi:uncharacterized protein YbaP (TraB family)
MSSPTARWLSGAGLAWLCAAALLPAHTHAQTQAQAPDCPPIAAAATEAQMRAGLEGARDRGLLWRISKDGRSSYLFGTLHVGKLEWAFPGPALKRAMAETELVAMELDVTDPAIQQVMSAPLPPEQTPRLDAALRRRLDAQAALACIPSGALAALHPVLQVTTYAVLAGRWEGLDAGYGQEFALAGFARALQRPLVGLETPESQRDALIPKDPAEALKAIEQALALLEGNKVRAPLKRMAEAWARGDLAELERYGQWCDCMNEPSDRAAMTRLNDERNPHLADGIAALHGQGKAVLAAVGSLHMTGPQALTRLLAERGFSVERIEPPR